MVQFQVGHVQFLALREVDRSEFHRRVPFLALFVSHLHYPARLARRSMILSALANSSEVGQPAAAAPVALHPSRLSPSGATRAS
jgi:hypothetical protein